MLKKMLLASAGIPEDIKDAFLSLLTKPPQENSVVFVTTAANAEENPWWVQTNKNQLISLGIMDIEDLDFKDKNQKELEQILSPKDIIFITGGNTFYLLYWLKKSGFDNIIDNLLNQGKIFVGVSAGSIITCPTIETAGWKDADRNKVGIKDLNALNLVPFLIAPHFEENLRKDVEEESKKTKYPVVALPDSQAILVEDEKYRVVGKGNKEFFNGFEEK